jgi:hypothetical protein
MKSLPVSVTGFRGLSRTAKTPSIPYVGPVRAALLGPAEGYWNEANKMAQIVSPNCRAGLQGLLERGEQVRMSTKESVSVQGV